MQKKTWLIVGAAVLGAAALLTWAFMPKPINVEVAPVLQADFEAGIEEDARTRLQERYSLFAPLAGRIDRLHWHEGDLVQAQQVVARIAPVLPPLLDERSRVQQQARVASAQAALWRAQARASKSVAAHEQARLDLARSEALVAQNFVSPSALDQARLSELAARKEAEAAAHDERVATADLAQTRAALGLWLSGAEPSSKPADDLHPWFELRAPMAGRIVRLPQLSATPVAVGTLVMELGDTQALEVVAQLLTTDAMQVHPGNLVRITRWGGSGDLHGLVRLVEPGAFTKVSALGVEEQRVNVVVDITSPRSDWQGLGDAYRVGVFIRTVAQTQALQAPLSAVFPLPSTAPASGHEAVPSWGVFMLENGHVKQRSLHIQARSNTHAWVIDGLKPGEQVVVYPPGNLREGARVKLRQVR